MPLKCEGKVILSKVKIADSSYKRFKGLMFEKKENFDYALVFELPRESRIGASVHMMFVFFPIGIVFLDSKKRVVDKAILNPWKLNYTPKKRSKYFVELPPEKEKLFSIGNILTWNQNQ